MNPLHTSAPETLSDLSWLASLSKDPLQSAIAYHRYGWHPIPLRSVATDGACTCPKGATCPRPGKHPLKANWTTTLTENDLIAIFSKHPASNIGLLTGFTFWVLDVDGSEGLQTLHELETTHGPLPQTLRAHTGSGLHIYFQMESEGTFHNRTRFAKGLDTRACDGQVVAPPSRHASGVNYRYSCINPIARAPLWLLELVAERTPESGPQPLLKAPVRATKPALPRLSVKERARLYLAKLHPAIAGQGGDQCTLHAACAMRCDFDLSEEQSMDLLREWNQRCVPPWSEADLLTKVRNADTYAKGERGKLARVPPTTTRAQTFSPPQAPTHEDKPYEHKLLTTKEGKLQKCVTNVVLLLHHDPAWKGLIAYDAFSERVLLQKPIPGTTPLGTDSYPRSWTDTDDVEAQMWLHTHKDLSVGFDILSRAIPVIAKKSSFHPVRTYLDNLRWDQTQRLATWLQTHFGAHDTPYIRAVGTKWLISAVARIYKPACKADAMLILEGPQGFNKSTALRILFSDAWFTDEIADLGSKDSSMQLQGAWGIELAELDGLSRAEVSSIKAFLSRTTDRFRAPYERYVHERHRQCVFAGTVNHSMYLRDETGGRRFWPVTCTHHATLEALHTERDQLWAEALTLYRDGHPWWLETTDLEALATEEQSARYQTDEWEQLVSNYLKGKDSVTVGAILEIVLSLEKSKWSRNDQMRVARCLTRLGWLRRQVYDGSHRTWKYVAPESSY